jgi:hypothetical protein
LARRTSRDIGAVLTVRTRKTRRARASVALAVIGGRARSAVQARVGFAGVVARRLTQVARSGTAARGLADGTDQASGFARIGLVRSWRTVLTLWEASEGRELARLTLRARGLAGLGLFRTSRTASAVDSSGLVGVRSSRARRALISAAVRRRGASTAVMADSRSPIGGEGARLTEFARSRAVSVGVQTGIARRAHHAARHSGKRAFGALVARGLARLRLEFAESAFWKGKGKKSRKEVKSKRASKR